MRYGMKAVLTLLLGLLLLTTLAACEKAPCEMHTYGEWVQAKATTCAAPGKETRTCTVCGFVETKTIDQLAHTPGAFAPAVAASCSRAGVRVQLCTVCGTSLAEEEIPALPHTYGEWAETVAATCAAEGKEARSCQVCEYTDTRAIPMRAHTRVTMEVFEAATCEKEGKGGMRCDDCGQLVEELTIPTVAHTEGEWTTETEPHCAYEGKRNLSCAVCGAYLRTQPIPAPGHQYAEHVIPATSVKQGYTEFTCGVCGDYYRDRYMQATSASAGLAYVVNRDKKTCTITGLGTCTDLDICIPGEIGKYTVTAIGEKAFAETGITGLTVLEGVTHIGPYAFYKCTSLVRVSLPQSCQTIGNSSFYYCHSLAQLSLGGAVTIGSDAFVRCDALTEIDLPDTLVRIEAAAFMATPLRHVTIPASVKWLEFTSFAGIGHLQTVTFENTMGWYGVQERVTTGGVALDVTNANNNVILFKQRPYRFLYRK